MDEVRKIKLAERLFLMGKSKHYIRKKLEVGTKKLDMWLKKTCEDKRKSAIHMFFNSNVSKVVICIRLDVDIKTLNKWIVGNCGSIKNTALYLYFNQQIDIRIISSELEIPINKINAWINEGYSFEKVLKFDRPTIQQGFSSWVSEIIQKHQRVS